MNRSNINLKTLPKQKMPEARRYRKRMQGSQSPHYNKGTLQSSTCRKGDALGEKVIKRKSGELCGNHLVKGKTSKGGKFRVLPSTRKLKRQETTHVPITITVTGYVVEDRKAVDMIGTSQFFINDNRETTY